MLLRGLRPAGSCRASPPVEHVRPRRTPALTYCDFMDVEVDMKRETSSSRRPWPSCVGIADYGLFVAELGRREG